MVPTAGSRWSSSAPRTAVSAGSASPVAWRGGFPDRRRLARERAMTGVASVGGCRRFLPLSRPFAPFTAPLARRLRTDEQQVLELGEARRPLIKRRPGLTVRRRRRQSPLQVVVRRLDDDVHQIDVAEGRRRLRRGNALRLEHDNRNQNYGGLRHNLLAESARSIA